MRGKTGWTIRLLCALALIVAMVPIRASGMACVVAPVAHPVANQVCPMPCCATPKASVSHRSCCALLAKTVASSDRGWTRAKPSCGCEIGSLPPIPPPGASTALVSSPFQTVVAILPPYGWVPIGGLIGAEPGIVGLDSGPPTRTPSRFRFGRAPPVARA